MSRKQKTLEERFLSKVEKTETCWNWTGARNSKGYGQIGLGTRQDGTDLAHRVSWRLYHGPIPDGLGVLHECDNPCCVNPAHLFVGTQQDNIKDRGIKGRQHNMLKTHCPKGHEYNEQNTYITRDGRRDCRVCNTERTRIRRLKHA